jgi:hypothetical protein
MKYPPFNDHENVDRRTRRSGRGTRRRWYQSRTDAGYGGTFTAAPSGSGYDFVPRNDSFFWTTVGFVVLGFTVAVVGGIVQLAAWVGALINTNRIADKTWFAVLLIGGLLGLVFAPVGFAAMVAYLVAGPDGMLVQQQPATPGAPHATLAPTT